QGLRSSVGAGLSRGESAAYTAALARVRRLVSTRSSTMSTTLSRGYQNLLVERKGRITIVRIHRPGVLNALHRETIAELEDFATSFVADDEQHALIVTGSGEKSFVSGADIQELAVLDPRGAEAISRFGQRVFGILADSI